MEPNKIYNENCLDDDFYFNYSEEELKYKKCSCDVKYWEIIVVQQDDHYDYRNVIYHYCQECDVDFVVEDFESGEILYYDKDYFDKKPKRGPMRRIFQ
ncbi:MAG: hypothetical protein A2X61_14210 [Ignavibacteria bacterium GWB2_35_12]|nr:MAG: hypothetical protein A2X63_10430 [Ignavibacteria bacterium GWA2_35_8]OGU41258.1 MAG: hypothetical protein A2X61_14210 [Ignavibacteria bacterium GWB2_35_12]OGU93286.1 MAG: hypothetical protein A2220_15015 [Ignavibacteria bacterium RIFOXYA2_FULL_35_10]OGV23182.1 MAG: hypothetical protein A2475_17540 [Ignavibacteria bacterium RIFOXYC2_FULL_35_21]